MATETCPAHSGMEEKIKNIDEKCDTILQQLKETADGIWKRVNRHLDESPEFRSKQIELATDQKLLRKEVDEKFSAMEKAQARKEDKAQAKLLLAVTVVFSVINIILRLIWH